MANNDGSSWRELRTVRTATEIIDILAEIESAGVTEIAERLGCSKSSIHSQLSTLEAAGYLTRSGTDYRLSHQILLLGEHIRNNTPLLQFGRDQAEALADETGHYAHLCIEEDGLGVNIYEARGELASDYDYQSLKLQRKEPLHITATGKAILAQMAKSEVQDIIDEHGLEKRTPYTITDERGLFDALGTIRKRGFAVNDEEEIEGFRAVAAPVCVDDGRVLGSISISAPKAFFDAERFETTIPKLVTQAANMVEVQANMVQ